MHEFSVTENLLDLAVRKAHSNRITHVHLLIGSFSEEREKSIQFYWRDLAKGSPAEGAQLHFDHVQVEMKCLDCTGTFHVDENEELCTCKYCYSRHLQLLNGEDVQLERIEIE